MRSRIILTLLVGVGCGAAGSAEPESPDAELLEFLGSWEGEGDEWLDFFDSMPDFIDEELPVDEQDDQENGR